MTEFYIKTIWIYKILRDVFFPLFLSYTNTGEQSKEKGWGQTTAVVKSRTCKMRRDIKDVNKTKIRISIYISQQGSSEKGYQKG